MYMIIDNPHNVVAGNYTYIELVSTVNPNLGNHRLRKLRPKQRRRQGRRDRVDRLAVDRRKKKDRHWILRDNPLN